MRSGLLRVSRRSLKRCGQARLRLVVADDGHMQKHHAGHKQGQPAHRFEAVSAAASSTAQKELARTCAGTRAVRHRHVVESCGGTREERTEGRTYSQWSAALKTVQRIASRALLALSSQHASLHSLQARSVRFPSLALAVCVLPLVPLPSTQLNYLCEHALSPRKQTQMHDARVLSP